MVDPNRRDNSFLNKFILNTKASDHIAQYIGLGIIFTYYLLIFSSLYPFSEYDYFLSLSIVTDSSYLALLLEDKFIPFQEGINFSLIPFIFDKTFISFFGIQNLWVMNIFYKSIAFIVLITGIKKLLQPDRLQLLLLSIMIGLFFCIDFPPFADRYPRPQFSNIFFFGIFLFNLSILDKKQFQNIYFFFYGFFHVCLALTNPWTASLISIMSLYSILRYKNIIGSLFAFCGFLTLIIPLYLYSSLDLSLAHREYLGLKLIYEPQIFVEDYFYTILTNEKILILFFCLLLSSIALKRIKEIGVLSLSLLFAPIPFLVLGKTIQTYHLLESARDFLIILCIVHICYSVKLYKIQLWNFKVVRFNFLCFIFITFSSLSLIFNYGNSWLDRANEKYLQANYYKKIYHYLDNVDPNCKLISNDINVTYYWSYSMNSESFLTDGFIRTSSIDDALKEVKVAIALLSQLGDINKNDIDSIIKYASHNYYVISRSTIAPSLKLNINININEYINSVKNLNTMTPWLFYPPNEVYELLEKTEEISTTFLSENKLLAIYTNSHEGNINFKVLNYCF